MRMPTYSRSVGEWVKYLQETEQTIDGVLAKTTSRELVGWLEQERWKIESRLNTIVREAKSEVEFLTVEEAEAVLSTPNEPDSKGQPASYQRGRKV